MTAMLAPHRGASIAFDIAAKSFLSDNFFSFAFCSRKTAEKQPAAEREPPAKPFSDTYSDIADLKRIDAMPPENIYKRIIRPPIRTP